MQLGFATPTLAPSPKAIEQTLYQRALDFALNHPKSGDDRLGISNHIEEKRDFRAMITPGNTPKIPEGFWKPLFNKTKRNKERRDKF